MLSSFVADLSERVLSIEADGWKFLGLLFHIAQERFGVWEIAALCEQLRFKEIAELNIEETCLPSGKISGLADVLLRLLPGAASAAEEQASAWST